jgi:hypothetical protein
MLSVARSLGLSLVGANLVPHPVMVTRVAMGR